MHIWLVTVGLIASMLLWTQWGIKHHPIGVDYVHHTRDCN